MNTDLLIATFNENISYIEENHPKLFSKLLALDNAVANGHYQERYELTFDNGYFDVIEKESGSCLYGKNSEEYASLAAASIEYGVEENLFECAPEHDISNEKLTFYERLEPLEDYMSGIAPLLHFMQNRAAKKDELQSLEKFIFFGVGLALHIETIHKKIEASHYLIVEDDLELFRLSLFTFNYKELSKDATLYFSVFDDEEEFTQMSEEFLKESYEHNRYIKYFEMLSHSELKRQEFHLCVANQAHLRFSYASMLSQSLLPLEYLLDSYQFLSRSVSVEKTAFEERPFLLLGAGPSLQKNMELLKKKKKSFVIVAISATLKILEKEGVVPDIVIHLDAFDASLKHFELDSIEFIRDSVCIFSAKTSPIITLRLDKENIFFFEDSTRYKKDSFRPSASCVGSMSYQILLYLKVKSIYLLGLDLAIDSHTGKTHSDGHIYAKTLDINSDAYKEEQMEYKKHLIEVDGNRSEKVKTTPHFKTSIDTINLSTQMIKGESQSVMNFGDGAMFRGVNPEAIESFSAETLHFKSDELHKLFSESLCIERVQEEREEFQSKLDEAFTARELILVFDRREVEDIEVYKKLLLKLVSALTGETQGELEKVYDLYFRYLLPYVFDFLNRENLELSREEFKQLNRVMAKHLLEIS